MLEDPEERPTMANIVLMLDSNAVTLPTPNPPAFFVHSRTDPIMPKELQFDQSITKSILTSTMRCQIAKWILDKLDC